MKNEEQQAQSEPLPPLPELGAVCTEPSGKVELWPDQYKQTLLHWWKKGARAAQQAARVPLTDEQVERLIDAEQQGMARNAAGLRPQDAGLLLAWYRMGLRDGERAHGIGTEQPQAMSPKAASGTSEDIGAKIVEWAKAHDLVAELCQYVDYDPKLGRVPEHWRARRDVLALVQFMRGEQGEA